MAADAIPLDCHTPCVRCELFPLIRFGRVEWGLVVESDSKRFSRCGVTKPLSDFNRRGRTRLQSVCRQCNSEYLKQHYRKNRAYYLAKTRKNKRLAKINARTYIWRYFETHPCVDCGETDPIVLQFDHVRGEKTTVVSALLGPGFSIEKVEAEIAKCEVRCANCHIRRTAKQFRWHSYMDPRDGRG